MAINEMSKLLKDGQPCGHSGCLNHRSHPCEKCGRIGGKIIPEFHPIQHEHKQKCIPKTEWNDRVQEVFGYSDTTK